MNLLQLHEGLVTGKWTCQDLVKEALDRIEKFDVNFYKLNSIAELNPNAMFIARQLDYELKTKGPRGVLHGIPVVVKDNICTKDEMHTTAGSLALADLITKEDATIIEKLKQQGAIIIAKSNLSEFAYWMSTKKMPSGYSSRGGQVINPYNSSFDPSGSSSGSAVAVAARLVPYAIGTETDGSLTSPSKNNAITTIKPTIGLVSRNGIIPISHIQDTAGPMGTSVIDCAIVLNAIAGYDEKDSSTLPLPKVDYLKACKNPVDNFKVGLVKFDSSAYTESRKQAYLTLKEILSKLNCDVFEIEVKDCDVDEFVCLKHEFKNGIERFLHTVSGKTKMKHLSDIIEFNNSHPDTCLKYGQDLLEDSDRTSGLLVEDEYFKNRNESNTRAHELTDGLMDKYDLNCLLTVQPTSICPISGNPVLAFPANEINETYPDPVQVQIMGRAFQEETLFALGFKIQNELGLVNRPSWAKEFFEI